LLTRLLADFPDDLLLLEVYSNRVTLMPAENKTDNAAAYESFLTEILDSVLHS